MLKFRTALVLVGSRIDQNIKKPHQIHSAQILKSMKNQMIIFATMIIALGSGCNQVKLTNEEAKPLVVRTLGLPISYRHDIDKQKLALVVIII